MNIYTYVLINNVVTIIATVAIVLGLYAMGAGAASLWGLLLLLNIESVEVKKP